MLKKDKKFQKGNPKMTHINRSRRPVQMSEKGSKPNQNANTIRPSSNVIMRNRTIINLDPGTIKKTSRTRKRGKININPNSKFTNLRLAPLIPNQRIRSSTTSARPGQWQS